MQQVRTPGIFPKAVVSPDSKIGEVLCIFMKRLEQRRVQQRIWEKVDRGQALVDGSHESQKKPTSSFFRFQLTWWAGVGFEFRKTAQESASG